tara:strand:+ start:2824 stop:3699 length:876 start_codon:yes stop_codon:yes gene_type:complete
MKKILCVTDKRGWCLYNIMHILNKHIKEFRMDVVATKEDKVNPRGYDLVYYTHFSLYDKAPCNNKKLATVTSHKCLDNLNKNVKKMKVFDGLSVNSLILFDIFKKHVSPLYYTPSGVDINNFSFKNKSRHKKIVLGWVGNVDRDVKNYKTILEPLKKKCADFEFKEIATTKKDNFKTLLPANKMADFYHSIDFFLVTSTNEGTPNPGLEAMSCGVPAITTRVGNMAEIVKDGRNGFFCEDNISSFFKKLDDIKNISNKEYDRMSRRTREEMLAWDWSIICKKYISFFKGYI